jgi:hypothetical protein
VGQHNPGSGNKRSNASGIYFRMLEPGQTISALSSDIRGSPRWRWRALGHANPSVVPLELIARQRLPKCIATIAKCHALRLHKPKSEVYWHVLIILRACRFPGPHSSLWNASYLTVPCIYTRYCSTVPKVFRSPVSELERRTAALIAKDSGAFSHGLPGMR